QFNNVFRWTRISPTAVRLEHLRFGEDQPVLLFELHHQPDEMRWASANPHVCGDDCYAAQLQVEEEGFTLSWTVSGPRKRERINYTYSKQMVKSETSSTSFSNT